MEKEAKSHNKGRVIVVDDDPDILIIITTLLEGEGYQVFQATDSNECLALLSREHPEVALIDFMLPDLNGLELVKLIHRIDEDLQLIAVTGQGSEKLAVEMMKSGAGDYISKPFENRELLTAVRRAFEVRRIKTSKIYRDLATANLELYKSMNEKKVILKSLADGLFSIDTNLRILSWNPAAETITGYSKEQALGRNMEDLFGPEFCRSEKAFLESQGDETFHHVEAELNAPGRSSKLVTVLKSASLLRGENQEVIGLVVTIKDISNLKALHQKRIEQERELVHIQEELRHQKVLAQKNKMLERNMKELNRKMSEFSTLYEVGKILTSKLDLGEVLNTVMNLTGKLFKANAYSIRLMDEEKRKLKLVAQYGLSEAYCQRGPITLGKSIAGAVAMEKKPIHVADTLSDKRFIKADIAQREGLKSLLCLPLIIYDRCIGVITFYHKKTHNYAPDEIRFLSTFASTVSIAIDNARLYEEKSRLAVTDGLTGLHNHKFFHETLTIEIGRAKRYQYSLAVILLDIDHFKKFNDAYGHQAGDALLREISALFKKVARENDLVARYGGEEFVFLLPQTNRKEALVFAKRLCRKVAKHRFQGEEVLPGGKLTISLGVAAYPEDNSMSQDLIHMADQALYLAKNKGRNQVQACQPVG